MNINPHEHVFFLKMQTLIPINSNEFTVPASDKPLSEVSIDRCYACYMTMANWQYPQTDKTHCFYQIC